MCSGGHPLCSGSSRSRLPTNEGRSKGSQYALCALGMGLVGLGVVMIVWTAVPSDATQSRNGTSSSLFPFKGDETKTSSVAFVLLGTGVAVLLLAVCLGVRNNKRMRYGENAGAGGRDHVNNVSGESDDVSNEETAPNFDVPTYEEAVTSGRYPVRQSNLRQSYQLPSYEDLISAVENEGQQPSDSHGQEAPGPGPQPAASSSQPARSGSRASRIFRPLRIRRIKSEKLHLKDIRGPEQGGVVTIEPLTPPPQYEDKPPQLSTEPV